LQSINVLDTLESVLQLANKKLQNNRITVERLWNNELPEIEGHSDHLKQVFLNLILNAVDAMTPDGGTLRVEASIDQAQLISGHASSKVRLEFSDTGIGMSGEELSRLFEPLFSTKEHGSGFGLFTSYKIVEAHQGQITATSQPGVGTTFTILLPVVHS
jgi:signal transduction histidine kinase